MAYRNCSVERPNARRRTAFAVFMSLFTVYAAAPAAADDRRVHQFGYVPVSDEIQIAYTLWRPSAEGKYPTLLIYNMYDASIVAPDWNQSVSTDVIDFLEAGYAVMGANARGTGCSTGEPDPLHGLGEGLRHAGLNDPPTVDR